MVQRVFITSQVAKSKQVMREIRGIQDISLILEHGSCQISPENTVRCPVIKSS